MTLRVLNDIHIGVERSTGTTPETRWKLRRHITTRFGELLPDSDLLINGDLFDAHIVAVYDVLEVYSLLKAWLGKGFSLYLVAGNHDLSKTSNIMSSFDMLGLLLQSISNNVVVITEPQLITYGYVIPHLANQTLFDEAIAAVPECEALFLHCNYSNFFATQADQSLNLSKEQAASCKAKRIIIAHEHSYKQDGKVLLVGNQIASSVADWLGHPTKYYLDGATLVACALKADEYTAQDWRTPAITDHKFVRIVGDATTAQASEVVTAISKFRSKSPALVISNAVNIAVGEGLEGFSASLEAARGYDVWRALAEVLTADEMTTLKGLE